MRIIVRKLLSWLCGGECEGWDERMEAHVTFDTKLKASFKFSANVIVVVCHVKFSAARELVPMLNCQFAFCCTQLRGSFSGGLGAQMVGLGAVKWEGRGTMSALGSARSCCCVAYK